MINLSGLSESELYLESIVDKIQHTTSTLECIGILREFGKLAFEAGREEKVDDNPNGFDILIPKYSNFEDYLKELYGEK